ncbi:hypothetical protein ACSAZL_21315 [Methanosarcina sp. T3]|uniref:hypothetical protein n=1 Tax=Methanosarcina sp. T3 TaxID=3439062 RepID=UPI003F85E330
MKEEKPGIKIELKIQKTEENAETEESRKIQKTEENAETEESRKNTENGRKYRK